MCEARGIGFCNTLELREQSRGFRCSCICHDPTFGASVSHVVACCGCPHRYYMREDCPECCPAEPAEDLTD